MNTYVFLAIMCLLSIASCQEQQKNETEQPEMTVEAVTKRSSSFIMVKLNDTIKLECYITPPAPLEVNGTASNATDSASGGSVDDNDDDDDDYNEMKEIEDEESTTTSTMQPKVSTKSQKQQDYSLFLFKKDNLLIQLHAAHLNVHFKNTNDEGLYECGYYKVDKFGAFNYEFVRSWRIQIEEVKTTKRNLLKNYNGKSGKNGNDLGYSSSELSDYDGSEFEKRNVNVFTRNPIMMGLLCVFMIFVLICVLAFVSWMNKAAASRKEKKDYLICANSDLKDPNKVQTQTQAQTQTQTPTQKVIYEAPTEPPKSTDATFIQIN